MLDVETCPGCAKETKPKSWSLCPTCLKRYGSRVEDWPEWLREQTRGLHRERDQAYVTEIRRIPSEVMDEGLDPAYVPDMPLYTRPAGEMAMSAGQLLPYAPYDNEDDNRRYRRANGIQERI